MAKQKHIVLDIWGGPRSQEHVARSILPMKEALQAAEQELTAGFLVNMRAEARWGKVENFDYRQGKVS